MHVVQEEHPLVERRKQSIRRRAIERAGGRALETVEHPRLVALGLQPAEEPGAGVRQAFVVEVDRVLRRKQDPDTERAPLFEERQKRSLRRRIRDRREVADDLVHVDDGAQARRAGLGTHPGDDLVEQQRHEEHPLRVTQMRNRENRDARLALGRVEQRGGVERLTLEPLIEPGGREQAVQPHRQLESLLRGEERLEIDNADLLEGRSSAPAG